VLVSYLLKNKFKSDLMNTSVLQLFIWLLGKCSSFFKMQI